MKSSHFYALALCGLVSSVSSIGAAQTTENNVTATSRGPTVEFYAPQSSVEKDREAMDIDQVENVAEALDESGAVLQSTNLGASSLIVRGLIGPENLIVIDGLRFSQSTNRTGPNQYLRLLDSNALQSASLMQGPGSVLYGTGAVGGVIHVTPIAPSDKTKLAAKASYRTAESLGSMHLQAGTKVGHVLGTVGITARKTGTLTTGGLNKDALFSSGIGNDDTFIAPSFDERSINLAVGTDLFRDVELRLNYLDGQINDAPRIDRIGSGEARFYDNTDRMLYLTTVYKGEGAFERFHAGLSFHHSNEEITRHNCDDATTTRDRQLCIAGEQSRLARVRRNSDTVNTIGFSFSGTSAIAPLPFAIYWGGDFYSDLVSSSATEARTPLFIETDSSRGNFVDGSTYNTFGGYVRAEYGVVQNDTLELIGSGGVRVEHFAAFAPSADDEIGDVSFNNTGIAGSLAVSLLVDTWLNSYAQWSQGYRAPNLQETTVVGDTGTFFEVPNLDLSPERSDTFEIGTKIATEIVSVKTAIWTSLISDKIVREDALFEGVGTMNDKPVQQRVNRDSAYYYGADLGLETGAIWGFSVNGGVSYIDGAVSTDTVDPTFEEGPLHALFGDGSFENPRRLPPVSYEIGLKYSRDIWSIWTTLKGNGSQSKLSSGDRKDLRICEQSAGELFDDAGCFGTSGWASLNVGGTVNFDNLAIDLKVNNLTDQRYRVHGSGVPAAGLNAMTQVRFTYGE